MDPNKSLRSSGRTRRWLSSSLCAQGSDARDAAMGRMFCYSALVRSGRASRDPALARRIAAALVQAKYYLREVSTATLLELLEQQSDSELTGLLAGADGVAGFLQIPASQATPEVTGQPRLTATFHDLSLTSSIVFR